MTPYNTDTFSNAIDVTRTYFQQVESALLHEISIKNWLAKHVGSVLLITGYLKRFPQVKEIVFCSDNDETGNRISFELAHSFATKGYLNSIFFVFLKSKNPLGEYSIIGIQR